MKIKVKNITLMDEIETQEAQSLYNKAKQKNIFFIIFPIVLFIVFGILMLTSIPFSTNNLEIKLTSKFYVFLSLTIAFFVLIFLGIYIFKRRMQVYFKLLQVAKINDKIRHEEKIRFNERERLSQLKESGFIKKYNSEKVDETLKNIDNFLNNRK